MLSSQENSFGFILGFRGGCGDWILVCAHMKIPYKEKSQKPLKMTKLMIKIHMNCLINEAVIPVNQNHYVTLE